MDVQDKSWTPVLRFLGNTLLESKIYLGQIGEKTIMFSRYFILSLLLLWIAAVHSATVTLSVDETSETDVIKGECFTLTVSLEKNSNDPTDTFIQAFVVLTGPELDGTIGNDLTSLPAHNFPIPISLDVGEFFNRQQFSIVVKALNEGTKSFSLQAFEPTTDFVTLGNSTVEVNVREQQPGKIRFTDSNFSVAESDETATITVERVAGSDGELSMNYATRDGTAIAWSDYKEVMGTLTWRDGESGYKEFSITIINDPKAEPPHEETVILELKDQKCQVVETATLTILELVYTDPPSVTLTPGNNTEINISGGTAPYEVISTDETVATVSVTGNVVTITAIGTGTTIIRITDSAGISIEVTVSVVSCKVGCIEDKACLCFEMQPNSEVIQFEKELTVTLNLDAQQANTEQLVDLYVAVALPPEYDLPLIFLTEHSIVTESVPFKESLEQKTQQFVPIEKFKVGNCVGGTYTFYAALLPENETLSLNDLASNLAVGKVTLEDQCF
ncbi:hypothetical protein PN36_18715 [Candidatus Thiomargarita nelsonii]|uniref:Calx-beta domain-containing protein n=1 Tax=Candidatus Thiomargarita nelsonii TaxID=1003181 RepID=A0A0A6RWV2_9GAMM|nr:hypothetical protein PN36_18715 [Candidatus Thiomargarita nelsonii]